MLLVIDVALGPLLTFIVFDRRKKSLRFDLTCIACMQIAALLYGLYTVEAGRPHYLVFVKDRFEVVSRVDLRVEDRQAAIGNRASAIDWFGPRIVAADMPTSGQERKTLLFEAALGGRDVQHFPKQYRDYVLQATQAIAEARRQIVELRAINADSDIFIQSTLNRSGLSENRLKFLPIKDPKATQPCLSITLRALLQAWLPYNPGTDETPQCAKHGSVIGILSCSS